MFSCHKCKIKLPKTQAYIRHGYPKSFNLCWECWSKAPNTPSRWNK